MLPSLLEEIDAELRALERESRLRACPPLQGPDRVQITLAGQPLVSFCSNDYLALANHPALADAAAAAARRSGYGAAASRLVSGDLPEHRSLQTALSGFLSTEDAVLFPTGYQANIGVVTTLARRGDLILSDAANHASLIDGCRLSRAEVQPYPHRDPAAVARALASSQHPRRIVLTESLFSMDGDLAPLAELADIASRHRAALVVDEAHALGVLGPRGTGLCHAQGVVPDALVGTLGKAFGAMGGFVAASKPLCRLLVNRARTFIFTTASPPAVAAAAQCALTLAAGPDGDARRTTLTSLADALAAALHLPSRPPGPILPLVLGADSAALTASAALRERGFFVQAIRPPTVAPGTARLRLTLSAAHTPELVAALARALHEVLPT